MAEVISLRGGKFDSTTREELAAAFDRWSPEDQRLVVHFHGGLVSEERGRAIAERLQPHYEGAGGHPLFVLWQSGLMEVIEHKLPAITSERIFQRMLGRVLRFVLGKAKENEGDNTRAVALEPPNFDTVQKALLTSEGKDIDLEASPLTEPFSKADELQMAAELRGDRVIEEEARGIANWLNEQGDANGIERAADTGTATQTLMSPEVLEELPAEFASRPGERGLITTARLVKGAVASAARVAKRLSQKRDHGILATSVEELLREFYLASAGRTLWRQMKSDTAAAFKADGEKFGGTAILEQLAAQPRWPAAPVLVGHSAGAIYVCNFLARADKMLPPERRFDVVLLAPACDFKAADEMLADHGSRVERLRIFAMQDKVECQDHLVPLLYRRSLLYLVSGVFESEPDWPLLGMERFYAGGRPFDEGGFPEIDRVRGGLADRPDSAVWSVASGAAGMASAAVHHGDFDDDGETLESVCHFISGR